MKNYQCIVCGVIYDESLGLPAEGNTAAVKELDEQIAESKVHAEMFKAVLEKAAKRFAALAKVEERHANHYKATLAVVNGAAPAA